MYVYLYNSTVTTPLNDHSFFPHFDLEHTSPALYYLCLTHNNTLEGIGYLPKAMGPRLLYCHLLLFILLGSRKINIINTCSTSTTVMENSVSSHSLTKFRIKRSIKYVTNYAGWHTPSLMHNKTTASNNTSYYFCKNFMT